MNQKDERNQSKYGTIESYSAKAVHAYGLSLFGSVIC